MAFFRQWSLILFALIVGGGQLLAAPREERAYAAAVLAFHDQSYSLAQTRLAQYLQTYRKSTNAPAAVLLLAQSEYYLKDYSAVTNRLSDPVNLARAKTAGLVDSYTYWRAEAQFANGDLAEAAQTFVSVGEDFPDSPLALKGVVEAAAAFQKLGQWRQLDDLLDNPDGLFQRRAQLAANGESGEQIANGRLLQAESKCVRKNFADAIQVLGLLAPATLTPEQSWKRAYLLYRANLGKNDLEGALTATTNLLEIARLGHGENWTTNLAKSIVCRATVLERQGRLSEASAALEENLSSSVPSDLQEQAILKLADLAVAQKNLTGAEAALDKFLTDFPDSSGTDIALLTLGELHLKDYVEKPSATNHLFLAQARLLDASTNGPFAGKVFLGRGWCNWLAAKLADSLGDTNAASQKTADSLADFDAAKQLLPFSEDQAVARFKMGDAQFALKNYVDAQSSYRAVLTDFSALPRVTNSLATIALYQILRAQLAVTNVTGMDDTLRLLLEKFFTSPPADSGLLLAGEGFADFDSPAKARQVFHAFEIERADSPLMPEVVFAIARTFEREQNWAAAVTNYDGWLAAYPANALRSQVEYAHAWAVSQTGDEAGALALFSKIVSNSTNDLTPLAHWWLADHYFRLGGVTNYIAAEINYQMIFENFPASELANRARLMAGRVALGRSGYSDAKKYFLDLITANHNGDLKDQALFAYCETLRQMSASDTNNMSLQEATNTLAQMYYETATNIVGALAWSETGDFDMLLGAYDAATNAYTQVLNAPPAAAEKQLCSRVKFGLGMALEKKAEGQPEDTRKALLNQAMEHYEDVFESLPDTADEFWQKKAGLQILALNLKSGAAKIEFIEKLKNHFPQLQNSPALKRLALKD